MKDHIFGEESNKFTNTLGESVHVRVCDTQEDTSKLLSKVLDGRQGAADILAKLVHSDISPDDVKIEEGLSKVPDDEDISVDDFGIWIDPIGKTLYWRRMLRSKDFMWEFHLWFLDGTNNYIKGRDERDANNLKTQDIVSKGLPVVTVLIGVST